MEHNIDKDIEIVKNAMEYYKNIDNLEEVPIDILRAMYKDNLSQLENKDKKIKENYETIDSLERDVGEYVLELETYKSEIKKYKHSMAMISEICIDESKVHITTREAIEEIRKYIYHGVDIDWARKEVEKDE